jgi:hypothetical protein
MTLAYLEVLSGVLALLSRAIPKLHPYHIYFGRTFMMAMYFTSASSILIHNTGMPRSIIFFMTLMFFSMTIGFGVIRFAQQRFQNDLITKADEILIQNEGKYLSSASELLNQAMTEMNETPITWKQRLFSLKALHGLLMTIAWVIYFIFLMILVSNVRSFHYY